MLRRPKKPGSRADLKRTPAQETAFMVFRLRGLWWMCLALTEERRKAAQALVDEEIMILGAESQTLRETRRRAEYEAEWARQCPKAEDDFEEVPF